MAAPLISVSDAPAPLSVQGPTPVPVNILLVDDQPGRLLTYRAILEPLGERLIEASSGEQALELLMEDEFAVILLDVNMPGMDGFETASLIHQHPRFEKTPIIFVTAVNVTDMDRLRGYKLGAVDYVSVPVIPEIMRTKVTVLAELFRKRRELQLANERLAAANEALRDEKARELEQLNTSLREANSELAARNQELSREMGERRLVEERMRFLADAIPSIVWTAAPDATVTYANRHWTEYYGRDPGGGPGELIDQVLHPEDAIAVRERVLQQLDDGVALQFEARHRSRDGQYRWFLTRALPWRDADDTILSWFGVTTDIDDHKALEERLREADRRKDEFLATLAHELRNPLAPLLNALNIRRLSAPDARDPLQDMMERQLALLVRLIDDLLDIARITRGKLVLRKQVTTLDEVLHSAIETAAPLIESGGHRLRLQLPSPPVPLHADRTRLSQVFANLLNNAAKYSDPGGSIELIASSDDGGIEVRVRDAGIGLAPEQVEHIFELFAQADTGIERARGGLGIGLTLVQRLTEMHDGQVSAHSEGLGRGSEFCVHLPVDPGLAAPEPGSEPETDARAQPPRDRPRLRALVLDDNRDATDTLAMMLDLLGLATRCMYDPADVEAVVADFAPDVVFLDVGMPGRSGYDVARALRAMHAGAGPLLVAVTGWGQPEDRRRTEEAGFDHHLVKPPELQAIQEICAVLEQRRHGAGP